jgi:hypothetical protein
MKIFSLKPIAFVLAFICIMIACEGPNDSVTPLKKTLSGDELSKVVSGMSSFQNLTLLFEERNKQIELNIEALSADDKAKLITIYQKYSDFSDFVKNASLSERVSLNQVLNSSRTDEIRSNFISLTNELTSKYKVNFKELSNAVISKDKSINTYGKAAPPDCRAVANQVFWIVVGDLLDDGATPQQAYNAGNEAYVYAFMGCMMGQGVNPE